MKKYRLYVASGLIAMMALSPLLSMADTLRYRYVISLDTPIVGNGGSGSSGGGEGEDAETENPGNEDNGLHTYTTAWMESDETPVCADYAPPADAVPEGVWYYQEGSDCVGKEVRYTYTYKIEDGVEVDVGDPTFETRDVATTASRGETGTKKEFSIYIDAQKVVAPGEVYLTWYSNGGVNYKVKSSSDQGGISTSYVDYGSEQSIQIYPNPGAYTYTVQGTNEAGDTAETAIQIEVIDFAIKNFKAKESVVSVGGDIHLTWDAPAGAKLTLAGYDGDVTGLTGVTMQAPGWIGSYSARLTAEREINGHTISSQVETTPIDVVSVPNVYVGVFSKVETVYANGSPSPIAWTSSSAVARYTIQSDDPDSGVPSSPIEAATNVAANAEIKFNITPTAGLYKDYTYTIKGYNALGDFGELPITVKAVPFPSIRYINPGSYYVSPGGDVTLSWSAIGAKTVKITDKQTNEVVYSGVGSGSDYSNTGSVTVPVADQTGTLYWNIFVVGLGNTGIETDARAESVANPDIIITAPTEDVHLGSKFRVETAIENGSVVTISGSSTESGWSTTGSTEPSMSYYEGTPTGTGSFSYSIKVTNSAGKSITKGFLVNVIP